MPARSDNRKKRVLSGMRSTGKLHLGNYVGALDNWVRMQDKYDCFFFVADWHALTTDSPTLPPSSRTRWKWRWTGWPPG
jgi:tryptophanyl-tRNA synthetase